METLDTLNGPVLYRRIQASYSKGREVRPPSLELAREVESGGGFELFARQTSGTLTLPGFTTPYELSSPLWASKIWVAAADGPEISRLLSEGGGAIDKALNLGVSEIEHDGKTLVLRWTPFREPQTAPSELPFLNDAGEVLARLVPLLPRLFPKEQPTGRGFTKAKRLFTSSWSFLGAVTLLSVSTIAASLSSFFYTPTDWGEWWRGLIPTILSVAFVCGGLQRASIRRYHLPRPIFARLLLLTTMFVVPLGWALFTFTNGFLDQGTPVEHRLAINHVWATTSKGNTTYHVGANASDGPGTVERTVTRAQYERIQKGEASFLVATMHPGFWKTRWYSRVLLKWTELSAADPETAIDEAYRWGARPRSHYAAEQSTLPAEERAFLVQYLHLMDVAVTSRVWKTMAIRGPQSGNHPSVDYVTIMGNLVQLRTPARFRASKEHALTALRLQATFFERWKLNPKLDPYAPGAPVDSAIQKASQALMAAYQSLYDETPGETATNRAAFRDYFAGVDFL